MAVALGTAGERLQALRESAQILNSMWVDEQTVFDGKYYQVTGAVNLPKGVQSPRIPLLIAGGGEKVTLKIAAEFGDGCNIIESPDALRHKYDVLKQHCTTLDRNYDDVLRTSCSYAAIAQTDAEAAAMIPPWAPAVFPGNAADYLLVGTIDTPDRSNPGHIGDPRGGHGREGEQLFNLAFLPMPFRC